MMKQLLNTLFVMTEDAYLALENDNVVIHQNDKTLAKVPLRSIEGIMCFSYKGASPALMGRCGKLGVSMAFYSPRGHYYCSVLGEENRNVLLRREQFRVADDEQKSLCYAKSFIVQNVRQHVVERRGRSPHGERGLKSVSASFWPPRGCCSPCLCPVFPAHAGFHMRGTASNGKPGFLSARGDFNGNTSRNCD